jgi:hypothetical protein
MTKKQRHFHVKISITEYGKSPESDHVYEIEHEDCTLPGVETLGSAKFRMNLIIQEYVKLWHPKKFANSRKRLKPRKIRI